MIAGKFRLTREIGRGGMGSVWAAVHEALGREVAVKFLHPHTNTGPSLRERFVSEARMVASIKHRFVVDVFDFGVTDDGLYYMVLELLHGSSLGDRMARGPAFSLREAVQLMADCLRGLHVVHEAGIVHCDLKPENIFVVGDTDGTFPKLLDFGISKRTEVSEVRSDATRSRLTKPGIVVGTPHYMSPEQLRGRGEIDRRADVYSVGVILYELLAGTLPFPQDNIGDVLFAITMHGAPALDRLRPELGSELAKVVARALAAKREDRYADALALRDALLAALPHLPVDGRSAVHSDAKAAAFGKHTQLQLEAAADPFQAAPSIAPRAKPERRGRFWIAAGALLAIGLGAWLLYNNAEHAGATHAASKPTTPPAAASQVTPPITLPSAAPPPAAPEPASVTQPDVVPVSEGKAASSEPRQRAARKPRGSSAATHTAPRNQAAARSGETRKLYRTLDF